MFHLATKPLFSFSSIIWDAWLISKISIFTAVGSSNWKFWLWKPWFGQEFWHEAKTWWWYWNWRKVLGRGFSYPYLPKMQWCPQTWCKILFCFYKIRSFQSTFSESTHNLTEVGSWMWPSGAYPCDKLAKAPSHN